MADRPTDPGPTVPGPTIVDAIRGAVIDSELAGLLWLLLDGGVPLTVAGPGATTDARRDRAAVLASMLDLIPASRTIRPVAGPTDDFAWIAAAEGLGWRRSGPASLTPADPGSTVIAAGELGGDPGADTTGDQARLVVRALGLGFGLAATAEAARLEDLLAVLRRRPIGLTDDELTNLGVVLILEGAVDVAPANDPAGASPGLPRVAAAHYVRPLARDVHGHPQRLGPAVLATWDARIARFEHFAWGVAAELAERVGRRTGDFELERERRSAVLTELAATAVRHGERSDRRAVRVALDRARLSETAAGTGHNH